MEDSLEPGPGLEKGNAETVQPVSVSLSNDSDPSYIPLENSVFTRAGNIGYELILEKLKVWRSSIEQVVTQGQDRVLAIENATSSLQEVVTNISSGQDESRLLITEVQSRLDNVSLKVDEKLNSLTQ